MEVRNMMREGVKEKTVTLFCPGDEGTAKGRRRGDSCEWSIKTIITLKPKS
jgi:hypothetical protein